jgi:hypothetical protein
VTFLNLRDFLLHKPFVVSVGFGEKSKKSQALSDCLSLSRGGGSRWQAKGEFFQAWAIFPPDVARRMGEQTQGLLPVAHRLDESQPAIP